ncbi:hypothetical protein LWH94_18265 [Marinobacter sp. G11]|uniref:hypothetical protein n=1 Tax=Marinobacter sp. G11 TaxID=2903522 RepID=UPI001E575823|nr:hypothetical protein [Marinobacter sp. G11]MCE0761124.1 hypothetical protein [Marinobacter sp. G11]
MKYLKVILAAFMFVAGAVSAEEIQDKSRNRSIPVEISYPSNISNCTVEKKCPVAFLSAGYGVAHTKYIFLTEQLAELGYMVVAIRHELPEDPALSVEGNLFESRSENWIRGARTLNFLKDELESRYPNYAFNELLLVGHSNGGDISAWLGNEENLYVKSIITLDHRRVPLPRKKEISILSIRGSDFPADKGVLPTVQEDADYDICVIKIPESKHNDMSDDGPDWLKGKIAELVKNYINGVGCNEQSKA